VKTAGSGVMSRGFWCGMVLALAPLAVSAQGTAIINPVYRRAQTMVNDGNAAGGRALVDSMIAVAAPGSNDYAEAVYWRAVIAPTAAEAEMDYRRVVVDYPRSPRVEDALIRLAQLELARGSYDAALQHLNRLAAEHPDSPARARAGYWVARALFDKNDVQGGCVAIVDALARTSETDTELRNQITYLNQRCAGVVLTSPAASPTASPPTTAAPSATSPAVTTPVVTTPAATMPAPIESAPVEKAPVQSAPTSGQPITADRPAAPPREAAAGNIKSKVLTAPPATPTAAPTSTSTSTPRPSAASGERTWSVQVAAYNVKSQADAMVTKLKKSGYEARVDGTAAPFRVRIGEYATQSQASAVQRSLKAKQITGFVVQADIR
jgi:cell division septation protein DedD